MRTPISGRIGRAQVGKGALISAAAATLLVRIDPFDRVNVAFNPSSSMVADLRHQVEGGQVELGDFRSVPVTILQDGGTSPQWPSLLLPFEAWPRLVEKPREM